MNLKIGQEVFLKPLNNAARRSKEIKSGIIETIGRKWFTLRDWSQSRFDIEAGLQDGKGYSPNWQAHETKQEIEDEREAASIFQNLRSIVNQYSTTGTLDQLRRIQAILNEKQIV